MKLKKVLIGTLIGAVTVLIGIGINSMISTFPIFRLQAQTYQDSSGERSPRTWSLITRGVHISHDFTSPRGRYTRQRNHDEELVGIDYVDIPYVSAFYDSPEDPKEQSIKPEILIHGRKVDFYSFVIEREEIAFQTQTGNETIVFAGRFRMKQECRNEKDSRPGFDGRLLKLVKGQLVATMPGSFYLECGC